MTPSLFITHVCSRCGIFSTLTFIVKLQNKNVNFAFICVRYNQKKRYGNNNLLPTKFAGLLTYDKQTVSIF